MPILVRLGQETFTDPAARSRLASMAAAEELVLIGTHHVMPHGRVDQLRRMLEPRRMVAVLLDDHMPTTERTLIAELLNDGTIPVILTPCNPPPPALTSWLPAGRHHPAPVVTRPMATPADGSADPAREPRAPATGTGAHGARPGRGRSTGVAEGRRHRALHRHDTAAVARSIVLITANQPTRRSTWRFSQRCRWVPLRCHGA